MLQSQRSAYRLQQRLNDISTLEYIELGRTEDIFVNMGYGSPSEYNDNYKVFRNEVLKIKAKYSRRRKHAIQWSMYGTYILVLGGVILVVVFGVLFFFF